MYTCHIQTNISYAKLLTLVSFLVLRLWMIYMYINLYIYICFVDSNLNFLLFLNWMYKAIAINTKSPTGKVTMCFNKRVACFYIDALPSPN